MCATRIPKGWPKVSSLPARQKKVRKFTKSVISLAVASILVGSGAAQAGAGWGDSTDATGAPIKVPTFYANSPSGWRVDPINPVLDPVTSLPVPSINTGKPLRKFVDTLAPLGCAAPNNLGQCIPVAIPDTTTYPGSDYYEIGIVQYQERMHSDLPKKTTLRGYVQLLPGSTTPMTDPHYMGPLIVATQGRPVRIKYTNLLPTGASGDLFVPVDTTLMGAGLGPDGVTRYTQNRAEIHLHGGDSPWISDGTPFQWTVPVGELTQYMTGASFQNVPDMADPGQGGGTLYWPNNQSGRLMFYHDHTAGITRVNVYAGQAAGYLLTDPVERGLVTSGVVPAKEIPLIIQDKTFVPEDIALQDAKWDTTHWGQPGDLWFPHVYEPNQDPNSFDGTNPVGRWDWGPWFWPVFPAAYALPTGDYGNVSTTPEGFHDTPVINGTVYPTLTVEPTAYRLRILNAANDRFLNLSLFVASGTVDRIDLANGGSGYSAPIVTITADPADNTGNGATASATVDPATGAITAITITNQGSGYTHDPIVTISDSTGSGASASAAANTETTMVAATPNPDWPSYWPTDAREGGVPDPATAGPDFIQIGNEGGLLPTPAVIPAAPVNYEYNRRSITVLNIMNHGLYMGPAERADVVVDFSQFAGKTVILYNDSPAPVPAFDPRIDYYSGNPDLTGQGGAPSTQRGYGPNTRTLMQIKVSGTPGANGVPYNLAALQAALPDAYAKTQPKPIVPESIYNVAFGTAYNDTWPRIYTGSLLSPNLNFTTTEPLTYTTIAPTSTLNGPLTYTLPGTTAPVTLAAGGTASVPAGTTVSVDANTSVQMPVQNKAIQELFEPLYGRMNATFGTELPFTSALTQTTIPLGYVDPVTETIANGETQIWKITHNGVDTHPVHFHLVNVQLINRIGWDGTIKPAEPNEVGWKETVKMNPLEDVVVAVRAKVPQIPFGVPRSVRMLSPSDAPGTTVGFTQVDPFTGFPKRVSNVLADFDWEYVWHCHILGHEENDMMRAIVFRVPTVTPEAPAPLTVSNDGTLTWTDTTPNINIPLLGNPAMGNPASEIGFKIQRSTDGVNFAQVGSALANASSWRDPAMGNQNYFYRVVAYNASGDSVPSNVANAWAPAPAMANLTGVATSPTDVALSWAAPASPVTGFAIQRCIGAACTTFTATANATGLVDTGLTPGTTYTYSVNAVNGPNAGMASNVTVTTQQTLAVAAPTFLTATLLTGPQVRLYWSDNANNESGFVIERAVNGGAFTTLANVAAHLNTGGMLYVDSTIVAGNSYLYRVKAVNGTVSSAFSNNATVTITAASAAPSTLSGSAVITGTFTDSVTLTWSDNSNNETGFRIQRATDAAFTAGLSVSQVGANVATLTQIGMPRGRTYYYRVQSYNGSGASAWSNTFTITTP